MLGGAVLAQAATLVDALRRVRWTLATAESCTGGLIAAALTHIPGSSDVFGSGYVTYSNEAKTKMLGVPPDIIASHGAVSQAVAAAMAKGALEHSGADIALSVTGIAGPGGGSVDKPVGLVWFGCAVKHRSTETVSHVFPGDRGAVRAQTVAVALAMALAAA